MNVLHISSTDLKGGRFTGYSMQQAVDLSYNVEMAVWHRTTDKPRVHQMRPDSPGAFRLLTTVARRVDDKLGLEGLTGLGGWVLPFQDCFKRADIAHLHLIHNEAYFSILSLPVLSRLKPVIWTIHDPWAMTGGCLYSFECDRWLTGCAPRCPHPRRRSLLQHYTPYLHWRVKKWAYKHTEATLVIASKWMQDRVQKSPLLHHFPCHLIPYGIDLETFRPKPKAECRRKLGIEPDHKVIAFRDIGMKKDRFKGMHWLMEALQLYEPQEPTSLLILQEGQDFKSLRSKYRVIDPGWVDGEQLVDVLCAADVFLMPSIQEAFGLMAVESMACATPVIVFAGTALPDVIKAPQGGLTVPARDSAALACAIKRLLENDDLRDELGRQARRIAEREYGFPLYVQRHVSLYEEVMKRHREQIRA